jgi:hypothetical protein
MAKNFDLPREEADEIIAFHKCVPSADFRLIVSNANYEHFMFAAGVVTEKGSFRRALSVEIQCHRNNRPLRDTFKFTLFKEEYGSFRRAYSLETTNVPLVEVGHHDWPHAHIGVDRVNFGASYPVNFDRSIAYFCKETNIKFEDHLESPLDFRLR